MQVPAERLAIQSCELIETELCFWIHIFFQNCVENPFMPQDLLFVLDPTEFRFDSPGKFHAVAYLQQIWWFEVDGVVKFPFPADIYTLSFRIHLGRFSKRLGRRVCNCEHTHGWEIKPVRFEFSTSDGQQASTESCLDETEQDDVNGNQKRGCWIDYKVGEFIVTESDPRTEMKFSMKQIDCTHSKGGLCVDSVSIIPSDLRERRRRKGVLK
ncbi:phloem protein 2-A15 [Actinidia rufa]|uniref:Phloem protein 2-A15 n=1 Tax=Actinidia rufa TaxID=165716 RepID=A0A7J0E880_9ERIC|nr:phloem protein 2-A15 [Actinidia rufa]